MFFRKKEKRSSFFPFVIFRLLLSLTIFALLLGGLYSAFQHFSGVDPLKLNPQVLTGIILSSPVKQKIIGILPSDIKRFIPEAEQAQPKISKTPVFSFILVADSHNENNYLAKALQQGKDRLGNNLGFIIGLGDYTEVGTLDELEKAKKEFDQSGIRYFLAAGDHDLWDARDKQQDPTENFKTVFGLTYQSFSYKNAFFIIIYNSDNYLGVSDVQLAWIKEQLNKAQSQSEIETIFVFLQEPLYHPSSNRIMGKTEDKLKEQAKNLTKILKEGKVKEVFAGDIHFFTRYQEPETGLAMTTIGAVASTRNTQAPRYGIVTVYGDGNYMVEDIEIK